MQILLIISLSERLLTPVWADTEFEDLLHRNAPLIQKSSSKTIDPVLDEIQAYGGEDAVRFLELWKNKKLFVLEETRELVVAAPAGTDQDGKKLLAISGFISRNDLGIVRAKAAKQIKPNSGVRAKIASALAPFQLESNDPNIRSTALDTIYRRIHPLHLEPLRQAMALEDNAVLKERMEKASQGKNSKEVNARKTWGKEKLKNKILQYELLRHGELFFLVRLLNLNQLWLLLLRSR